MTSFYQLTTQEVFDQLRTTASGLKSEAVPALQKKYGANVLQEAKQKTRFAILLSQFSDVMIIILVIAAIISFAVGEPTDAIVILAIIIANAWMGYHQEYNAEKSVRMLKKMSAQSATVLRNDNPAKIEADKLVPGDIILLEAGDIVPADARLIEVHSFKTDEASLTGESHSIEKKTDVIKESNLVPGDQLNMIFKGTIVSNGSAKAVVTTIGMNTELGKIAGMLEVESQKTPLQKRLSVFSKQLAVIVIIICLVVFGIGLWRGESSFVMFLTALSLAVAALPEALPAVITIALARGARRMVKQNALMRKLPAVETLGSVTYICSDKTGTLTQNNMTVEKLEAAPDKEDLLKHAMILNNEVKFSDDGLLGDSTETALVDHALKKGHTKEGSDEQFPHILKIPFDSGRMRMSTLHKHGDKWILFVKGAPTKMVEIFSGKYKEQIKAWLDKNREWAADGLRVLFFGYKIFDNDPGEIKADAESELDFLGMAALIDPPREEVIESIRQCKTAGIKSVMITGDQPLTAKAIADRLGMIEKNHEVVKTGVDLEKLSAKEFNAEVKKTIVYARVSPEQKLNIVKALQSNGEFVAMTGDGVNDAPSLKQADIGVAMGITGTDVSKESADMILLVQRQLNPGSETTQILQKDLDAGIKAASSNTRAQIYYLAHDNRSKNWEEFSKKIVMERSIPIFRALIASDTDNVYHLNHGQLGFALKDLQKPNWKEAESELTRAIDIRGSWQKEGWLFYEFNRAICRMNNDESFLQDMSSTSEIKNLISADLKTAEKTAPLKAIISKDPTIQKWLSLNKK